MVAVVVVVVEAAVDMVLEVVVAEVGAYMVLGVVVPDTLAVAEVGSYMVLGVVEVAHARVVVADIRVVESVLVHEH